MGQGALAGKVIAGKDVQPMDMLGSPTTVLLRGKDTGGAFSMWEAVLPPGVGVPPHRHQREDELLYVLEGALRVMVAGQVHVARVGTTIFAPRTVIHSTLCEGDTPCKVLVTVFPAGVEEMFAELDRVPPGPDGGADMARIGAIVRNYGIEFM